MPTPHDAQTAKWDGITCIDGPDGNALEPMKKSGL